MEELAGLVVPVVAGPLPHVGCCLLPGHLALVAGLLTGAALGGEGAGLPDAPVVVAQRPTVAAQTWRKGIKSL